MKRGQAALEFLTTYGWAFLVILIMISTLAYFGVLKPSKILPDRCSFGAEFECRDFQIARGSTGEDGTIKIKLKNNAGDSIMIDSVEAFAEAAIPLNCPTLSDITGVWPAGQIKDFTLSDCNSDAIGLIPDEKGKILITISYYSVKSGSEYMHRVNGDIFATVI